MRMMANGWKTPKQIQQDYGISQGTFYDWKQKCESSQFKDAIVRPTGKIPLLSNKDGKSF